MSTSEYPATRRLGALGQAGGRPRATEAIRLIPVDAWAVGALILVAAAIRIVVIDNQSFWTDEALTAYEAHLPFGAMIHTVLHVETTPPLYFVLIWLWAHVLGTGEVALRSFSTIAGIALVPVAYLAARELVSRRAGVLAAAFVSVNPFLIWYSQEARSYMLLALLTGLSFLFFVRAWREPARRNLAGWAIASALAVTTHYFAGFLVAPEALWLLWAARGRLTVAAVAAVGAVQVAMLPLAVAGTGHGPQWVAQAAQSARVSRMVLEWSISILMRRVTRAEGLVYGAAMIAVVALLVRYGGDRRTRQGAAMAGAIVAFVLVVPLALGVVGQDYFLSRNEIPAVIPVVTVLAAACTGSRARLPGALLALVLLAMFSVSAIVVQTQARYQRPDWRAVARALGPASVPRYVLAADGTTADPLKIYLPGVSWTQPHRRRVPVAEIVVIGATKKLALAQDLNPGQPPHRIERGRPLPRSVPPAGMRLISRFRVENWVLARFALLAPRRLSIARVDAMAPELFRHTPAALLAFVQRPVR